ncbi:MAG: cyanophycinase [Bacteroidales bacterium]|nr:cyanophycinase [Bacteroidales bacterium]
MKQAFSIPASLTLAFMILHSCSGDREAKPLSADTSLTRGPEKGSLVIVGGAMRDTAIIDRFIELAGGPDAPIVVIPTASGASGINNERTIRFLTERGASDVTVLHTYDSLEADTPGFTEPIKRAMGLWFTGGRQWRIVDAYGGTATEEEIRKILERGGVIGGSSAGATIQGSYLARGDTKTNTIMMGDHERGFSYLSASAIDQHLLVRNRQHDLVEVIEAHPHLLGIGLDENTAIIVRGDEFEVMGESFVAVYDHFLWAKDDAGEPALANGGKFFLLREGDRYNVHERRVTQWSGGSNRDIFAVPDSALVSVK